MGLAITESLVKLQGGSLGLESEPGKGSCFYFSLPMAKAVREAPSRVVKVARKAAATPKILTIEDDRMASHLLESQLSSSGYEVISCNQPEHALEMAADFAAAGNHAGPADEAHERLGDPAAIEA